nr:MAG TPA: Cby-like protein [Caudoviricetes sp.]
MNRDKEISNAALKYTNDYGYFNCNLGDVECGFVDGAKWADEHPSSSFIVKVWNLATKTAIAQINKEIPYFKSENEIKEYIKKHIRL